ncbi:MAG: M20/M25/M40 family metallo-hydrolase [Chloroflexota bacterium]|nr:M20/M25/M40 family metallo-hydrolase [Chloroflexota bacterium]
MDALDRWIVEHQKPYTEELRELCAIPSEATDPAALDRAAAWCMDRMRAAGCATREVRIPDVPALAVGEVGAGRRTLIAVQHYDVQPAVPLELWASPPYEPAVRDGAMYARGVSDNKGHLLLRIQAIEAHRAALGELPVRVRFLIEGQEEGGSVDLHRLIDTEPGLIDGDGALKEGGQIDPAGRPSVSCGNKGILYVQLHVRTLTLDAHSAGATHLPNAAWRLNAALGTLVDERGRILIDGFYDDVTPVSEADRERHASQPWEADEARRLYGIDRFAWGRGDREAHLASAFEPTCNICGIWSGYTGSKTKTVIPSEAFCKIDFRLVPEQDPDKLAKLLRAHLDRHEFTDVEVSYVEGERAYRGALDDPLVKACVSVAEEAFGKPATVIPNNAGTSPMWVVSHRRRLGNATLGMAHVGSAAHAPNENVLLAHYWRALRATARLYSEYARA